MEETTNQNAGDVLGDQPVKPKHGGVRLGTGRPPKQKIYATSIGEAEELIKKGLPKLLTNNFELAAGVKIAGKGGGEVVYERLPDGKIIADLLDRIKGKPIERIEAEDTREHIETTIIILPDNGRSSNLSA